MDRVDQSIISSVFLSDTKYALVTSLDIIHRQAAHRRVCYEECVRISVGPLRYAPIQTLGFNGTFSSFQRSHEQCTFDEPNIRSGQLFPAYVLTVPWCIPSTDDLEM